jgi:nitrogen fixation protein NifU and related proteins
MQHLYRQVIMDHYKDPRNQGIIQDKEALIIHLNNPSCGDEMTVSMMIQDGKITNIKQQGTGCSICCASASMMTEAVLHHTKDEALQIIEQFYELVKGLPFDDTILTKEVQAFSGVSQFPTRIKCATLAWKACEEGLKKK